MNDYYDAYNRWYNLMLGGIHIHTHINTYIHIIIIFWGGGGGHTYMNECA